MKHSLSEWQQPTSHWKSLLSRFLAHAVIHFTVATCGLDTSRVLQTELPLTDATRAREMRRAPTVLKECAALLHTLIDENIQKQDMTQGWQQTSWFTHYEPGKVLCPSCKVKRSRRWCGFGVYECPPLYSKKGGRGEYLNMDHWPPANQSLFRLCRYYPTDLSHLAAHLHFGTSSMRNVPTLAVKWRENENGMIWVSFLIHGLSSVLCSISSPPPSHPFLPLSSSSSILSILPSSSSSSCTPPLGNQCVLSFRGTRRHIDLAAHTQTHIDLARRSSSIGMAKRPFFFLNTLSLQYTARSSLVQYPDTDRHTHKWWMNTHDFKAHRFLNDILKHLSPLILRTRLLLVTNSEINFKDLPWVKTTLLTLLKCLFFFSNYFLWICVWLN